MTASPWKLPAIVLSCATVATSIWGGTGLEAPTAHAQESYMGTARGHVLTALEELQESRRPATDAHRERAIEACNEALLEIDRGLAHTPEVPPP